MDVFDDEYQSFFSWPFLEEPAAAIDEQTPFSFPYLEEEYFVSPSFNDSYDLLPLPDCLELKPAIQIACLTPDMQSETPPELSFCSEDIMEYCTYSSSAWESEYHNMNSADVMSPLTDPAAPLQAMKMDIWPVENLAVEAEQKRVRRNKKPSGRRPTRLGELGLEEIKLYFGMPITQAAVAMNIGLTVLKKRCRDLGITRWPHRKMKSLNTLINNIQELGRCTTDVNVEKELKQLEEHRKLMEENPEIQLTEKTKKLRQACFKANYKRRVALHRPFLDHLQRVIFN